MFPLMQILVLLTAEQREEFRDYFEDIGIDFSIEEEVNNIPVYLYNHYGIHVELSKFQLESIHRIVKNGSWVAAFNLMRG